MFKYYSATKISNIVITNNVITNKIIRSVKLWVKTRFWLLSQCSYGWILIGNLSRFRYERFSGFEK